MITQLNLWMQDRAATGRHPRSRWATQALVLHAGPDGITLADLVTARALGARSVWHHLRRLEGIGRFVRRGRWFAASATGQGALTP